MRAGRNCEGRALPEGFDSAGVRKNLDAGFMDQIDAILERLTCAPASH